MTKYVHTRIQWNTTHGIGRRAHKINTQFVWNDEREKINKWARGSVLFRYDVLLNNYAFGISFNWINCTPNGEAHTHTFRPYSDVNKIGTPEIADFIFFLLFFGWGIWIRRRHIVSGLSRRTPTHAKREQSRMALEKVYCASTRFTLRMLLSLSPPLCCLLSKYHTTKFCFCDRYAFCFDTSAPRQYAWMNEILVFNKIKKKHWNSLGFRKKTAKLTFNLFFHYFQIE